MIYQRSLAIPEEIRPDVIEVIDRTSNVISFNLVDLKYLFEIYNRYISSEEQDIECSKCRSYVISKLRYIVKLWKEQDANNSAEPQL